MLSSVGPVQAIATVLVTIEVSVDGCHSKWFCVLVWLARLSITPVTESVWQGMLAVASQVFTYECHGREKETEVGASRQRPGTRAVAAWARYGKGSRPTVRLPCSPCLVSDLVRM